MFYLVTFNEIKKYVPWFKIKPGCCARREQKLPHGVNNTDVKNRFKFPKN